MEYKIPKKGYPKHFLQKKIGRSNWFVIHAAEHGGHVRPYHQSREGVEEWIWEFFSQRN